MANIKIKFKNQLRKEKIIAKLGYGNGYSLYSGEKMIGFIPFSSINRVYYDWESSNKGYMTKTLLQSIREDGFLDRE